MSDVPAPTAQRAPGSSTSHAAAPLSPLVRRLFVGVGLSALGSGLTMPFLYVYLAEVRGIPTATVGLLFAWMGLLGFATSPLGGTLIDRFGPRIVMVIGLAMEASGVAALGLVTSTRSAFVVGSLVTLGTVGLWPATTALLTRMVPEESRERVYGLQFMLMNAGLGVGGLIASMLVNVDDPATFQRLYLFDAFSYLAYIAVAVSLPRGTGKVAAEPTEETGPQPGWGTVLKDRTLMRIALTSVLAITFGYAQVEAGFAAFTVEVAGVEPRALGWAFGANTGAIVLGQLVTLRLMKGRRRSRLLALCLAVWSASWLVIAASSVVPDNIAVILVVVGLGTFGLGETLWAPVAPAIVNDLAPEELRGRYNALQGMTWTVAMIVGPALAGLLIGNDLAIVWVCCTVGGTALASVLFLNLGRHLSDGADGVA